MRLYTSCLTVRRVLLIYYLPQRLLISFSPKTPLTLVFKPRIVEPAISEVGENRLDIDCVKSFKRSEKDSGIMVAFEIRRYNVI